MASIFFKARERFSPALKTSAFLSRGVLTPEEFVRAGDELVFKCPTWSWSGGDPKYARSHLPPEKQFLITRNVPCSMRVESMENAFVDETEVETPMAEGEEGGDNGEGWLVSHVAQPKPKSGDLMDSLEDDFDVLDVNGDVVVPEPETIPTSSAAATTTNNEEEEADDEDDDDEYADMADYEDDDILEDEDVTTNFQNNSSSNLTKNDPNKSSNILQTRTYDISITYDKYYQTPRVWIFGYKEDGITPLTPDEMFEDVMSDYVKRTVTIETHPHVQGVYASIHPCQHGAVMKNIVQNMMSPGPGNEKKKDTEEENINAPTVEMYLFIFLKFVSSIIPTINYDFTMEVAADTRKA